MLAMLMLFPRIVFFFGFILAVGLLRPDSALAQDVPITYVRCARTDAKFSVTGDVVKGGVTTTVTRVMTGVDVYDILPDVTHFFKGFSAPCDLILRQPSGEEKVLYDCSSTSTTASSCAAMDPVVSFDGKTIAFAVFRGPLDVPQSGVHPLVLDPLAENQTPIPATYPNRFLDAVESQLHLVDVATGKVTPLPYVPGGFDTGPVFLPNGRLAFTSSRDGHTATMIFRTYNSQLSSQLWTMDLDGRNLDLISHHGLALEEHAIILQDGRLAYSSWQIFGGLPFRHDNGAVGGPTTASNLFHIYTQRPDGSNNFAFFGEHAGDHFPITSTGMGHQAAHFLTQTSDGRVWFADYYRGNNNGLGGVIGVMPEADGREGLAPVVGGSIGDLYAPTNAINVSTWGHNGDEMSRAMPAPAYNDPEYADPLPFVGKLGHPAALPDNKLMLVWGKGACGTVATNDIYAVLGRVAPPYTSGSGYGTAINVIASLNMDTPGCDAGIYLTTQIPSKHPSDLQRVVDTREWHEIQPRAVVPYAAIHGVDKPTELPRSDKMVSRSELEVGTPFGLLGAASILDRETHPIGGIHFAGLHQFNLQGTDTIDYTDDQLCGIRILGVLPNRGPYTFQEIANVSGERVAILGEVAVRKRDATGAVLLDASGNPDTSFLVRFPADMAYLTQGIDCDGRTLNTDQSWQSLRPGETQTCGGCHVHSREPRVQFDTTFAATPGYQVPFFGMGEVSLLAGETDGEVKTRTVPGYGLQVDFTRDIMPIFQSRCVSCHGGAQPVANLALDKPGTAGMPTPSTWWCLVADVSQQCVPPEQRFVTGAGGGGTSFPRPQLTRYVRAFNSLASPLYWKAAGKRTDGRTDDTYNASSPQADRDIDFGPAHTTTITADELGLLSRWIDLGCPGGAQELRDTQRPTLNLSALVAGGVMTSLQVGTVDVGSGIDTTSLQVCLVSGDTCGANLAPAADPHGVVSIAAALSDLDQEVEARVKDVAGNETVVRRTVRALLDAPPVPPPPGENPSTPTTGDGPSANGGFGSVLVSGCQSDGGATGGETVLVLLVTWAAVALRRRVSPKNF